MFVLMDSTGNEILRRKRKSEIMRYLNETYPTYEERLTGKGTIKEGLMDPVLPCEMWIVEVNT